MGDTNKENILTTTLQEKKASIEDSNQENNKESKLRKYKIPEYLKKMNELEKRKNNKIIKNMNKRINFLRNPRFRKDQAPITFNNLFNNPVKKKKNNNYKSFRKYFLLLYLKKKKKILINY